MRRTTVIILGSILLVVVLLCAALSVVWLAGREGTGTSWAPRWDRDRHHFDAPTWEPLAGSGAGLFVAGLLGLLSWLLLAGGLVLGGVWLARGSRRRPAAGTEPEPPEPPELEALRGRYARGEISREEYLARRDELNR